MAQRLLGKELKIIMINLLKEFSSEKGVTMHEKMGTFQNKEGIKKDSNENVRKVHQK